MHINRSFVLVYPDELGTTALVYDDALANYARFILVDKDVDRLNELAIHLEHQ